MDSGAIEWIGRDYGDYLVIQMERSGTSIFIHGNKIVEVVAKGAQPQKVPFAVWQPLAVTPGEIP